MASAKRPPCSRLARENTPPTESQLPSFQPPFSAASNAESASFQLASASLETTAPEEDFTTLPFSSFAAFAGVVPAPLPADEPPQAAVRSRAAALIAPSLEVARAPLRA